MSESVRKVRRLWGLLSIPTGGRSSLRLIAREPTAVEKAAAAGVLLVEGMLKDDCHDMTVDIVEQFPRIDIFAGRTGPDGIAAVVFDPAFTALPRKALPVAVNNLVAASVAAEIVPGSLTANGCRVLVRQKATVGEIVSPLAGANVQVTVIGA